MCKELYHVHAACYRTGVEKGDPSRNITVNYVCLYLDQLCSSYTWLIPCFLSCANLRQSFRSSAVASGNMAFRAFWSAPACRGCAFNHMQQGELT